MENSILTLNLPYKVKIIETKKEEKNNKKPMINFSIIIITENDEEKLGVRYVTLIDGTKINEDKFFEYYVEHGNSEEWRKRLSDYVTRPFKVVSNFRSGIAWNRNTTKQVINEAVNKQTITPNNFVYYKTEPINRESIINNGLYPLIDVKYEIKNKKKHSYN